MANLCSSLSELVISLDSFIDDVNPDFVNERSLPKKQKLSSEVCVIPGNMLKLVYDEIIKRSSMSGKDCDEVYRGNIGAEGELMIDTEVGFGREGDVRHSLGENLGMDKKGDVKRENVEMEKKEQNAIVEKLNPSPPPSPPFHPHRNYNVHPNPSWWYVVFTPNMVCPLFLPPHLLL